MVLEVKHSELKALLKEYYKKKLALFLWGSFGLGKSQEVRETAKELAKERKREFVEWNKTTTEEKENLFNNPEKYFILIDIRLSEADAGDMRLPYFKNDGSDTFEWKIPKWAKLTTNEKSDGIVFFDECNLATPLVLSSAYKVIYDRCVDDSKIGDSWLIIGAGNLETDRANVHILPSPLRDRGGEIQLMPPSIDDWTNNFALPNGIDSRIIGYLNFEPSFLRVVNFKDNQKFVTERGWERLSKLIKDVKDYNLLGIICKSAIGEGTAGKFVAFCKISEKLNLEDYIKHPEKIEKLKEKDVLFFLVSALAERYRDSKIKFDTIIDVSKVLEKNKSQEFTAVLWRFCVGYKPDKFKSDFLACKENELIERYGKLIV